MKKKIICFVVIFAAIFVGTYLQAAAFPNYPKKVASTTPAVVKTVNVLPYTKVAGNTYSELIGKTTATLEAQLGKAEKITAITAKRSVYDYGADYSTFLKVYVEEGRVVEIFCLGEQLDQAPFKFEMTLSKLSQLTPLQANFQLNYMDESISFELSEDELDLCPLIAFDNDTFGIFYFDGTTKKLLGINYLSTETLLEQMPYQLNEGQIPLLDTSEAPDKAAANALRSDLYRETIDVLRQKNELATFGNLQMNNTSLLQATQNISQNYAKFFTKQEAHDFQASQVIDQVNFKLTKKRASAVLKDLGIEDLTNALMRVPKIDVIASAVTDFTSGSLAKAYHAPENQILSIAFDDNLMVVLITSEKISPQTSSQEGL